MLMMSAPATTAWLMALARSIWEQGTGDRNHIPEHWDDEPPASRSDTPYGPVVTPKDDAGDMGAVSGRESLIWNATGKRF